MKKWLFSALFLLLSPAIWAFSQQDLVNLLQKPHNTQGQFTQQRFLKALNKPIQTSGQFALVKEQGLLWQTVKPFANQLRVKSDGISQWNGKTWVKNDKLGQAEQIGLFLGLLSGDTQKLSQQFNLTLQGNAQNWQLSLTPSSFLMKQIFESIEIRGDNVVKQIELKEKQGDRTLINFTQTMLNQPLTASAQSALQ
ncbi:LolA family protein [Ursidibacter sp. B-7004-1]